MKYSVVTKFLAILLAACALTVAVGSAVGVIFLTQEGLYDQDYQIWEDNVYRTRGQTLATCMAESYAARELGDLTVGQLQQINWGNTPEAISTMWYVDPEGWCYQIADKQGNVLESNYTEGFEAAYMFINPLTVNYPVQCTVADDWEEKHSYQYQEDVPRAFLYLRYEESPEFTVTVWMAQDCLREFSGAELRVVKLLADIQDEMTVGIVAGLLLAAACIVYLCCAAGRSRLSGEIRPGGLNRLPLDFYGAGAGGGGFLLFLLSVQSAESVVNYYHNGNLNMAWFVLSALAMLGATLCVIGFVFALAAQGKMGRGYIWRNSLVGRCLRRLKQLVVLGYRALCKLIGLLPLTWKYLLIAVGMGTAPVLCGCFCLVTHDFARVFWLLMLFGSVLAAGALVCYGAFAYGTVLKGARRMAEGALYTKIDTRYLVGSYRACAENVNALADAAVVAAKNQMRSDRMKTELITNVSHDIKTPLTSIINYIDLLQKAQTPEQSGQYLEVLERQSQRLKKLIEDLMEMSRATTGDIHVELTQVDPVEAVNQALGEFADKLDAQGLQVIFRQPEGILPIRADGRLSWRVLSNLLSNVVKYALPGTRVYIDMQQAEGKTRISMKNISREALNVSAEELTERFVRGDASRHTEGSGLGLNIAKSLMELQKGKLELLVDGDLFKVTLVFPTAE